MINKSKELSEVYLIGVGNIGNSLLEIINHINLPFIQVSKIASSKKMLINYKGLNLNTAIEELNTSGENFELKKFLEKNNTSNKKILVDCTASNSIANKYIHILDSGFSIVTANKIANSIEQKYYDQIRQNTTSSQLKFKYETNVGGGLPIISTIKRLINTGDEIIRIEGILSGTLSYLFSKFNPKNPFSNILIKAKNNGFTEPDPRNDLSGIDVARKILILARETGYKIELKDVHIDSLIPSKVNQGLSIDTFLSLMEKFDHKYENLYNKAQKDNKKLRYIASWDNKGAKVGLQSVSNQNPFYYQSGRENFVTIKSKRYFDSPIVIKGHGAGASVTAAGVFHDICNC